MISCPFCNKLVLDDHSADGEEETVPDNETWDFNCPTYVNVHPGVRWSHYTRRTFQGSWPEYEAIMPPFQIRWWDGLNTLEVRQFNVIPENWRTPVRIHIAHDQSIEDFIKHANRMAKLKAFT